MELDLEKHLGLDPHVETSREELELGLPPSISSDALEEVLDPGYTTAKFTVMGIDNTMVLAFPPNGIMRASSTSPTDLQQAEVVPAADGPCSLLDNIPWPEITTRSASLKGTGGEVDLLTRIDLTSEVVHEGGEAAIFGQPRNAVPSSYSVFSLERIAGRLKHEASEDASTKLICHENDAPICKVTEDEKYHERDLAISTKPGNGSKDSFGQKEVSKTFSVECPEAAAYPISGHMEHCIGEGCAETECSRPAEAVQGLQVESLGPNVGSSVFPGTFSGLFQSILASESASIQVVETTSLPNVQLGTAPDIPTVNRQAAKDIVNATTRLMLDSLNQPPPWCKPPGLLQTENALEPSKRMKPNTIVPALAARPTSLPIQAPFREARVASAATTVSAAASAAKSAVEAAEASIEALAQLGINNGSLYQGKTSFVNPRPLQMAWESRPLAAGDKRKFQGQRPQTVGETGGKRMSGPLDLIKTGLTVEVMPAEDGLQGGWFIAKVLSMTPKEALVVYDDLITDDGRSHLEESFPLHCSREEDIFGTTVSGAQGWIRPVHPFSSSLKRHHVTMAGESWVVGDHVDAYIEDGWWEGIIEDLSEEDETRITVYCPGDESTTVVRAWNVRPSLIWNKGEWRPCRGDSVEQNCPPSKKQKRNTVKSKVEKEPTKTKVAAPKDPVPALKSAPEPLSARAPTRRSVGAHRNGNKGMIMYTTKTGTEQKPVYSGVRELRSGTRAYATPVETAALVNSSNTNTLRRSIGKAPASKDPLNGRSKQIKEAVTPEPSWDVRRLSTRLQEKEASQSTQDRVRGKTPSSRSSQKEIVLATPQDMVIGKTPSSSRSSKKEIVLATQFTRSQPKQEPPSTRARTRSQR